MVRESRRSPDFDQGLPIHQCGFDGGQVRSQCSQKRGIGSVPETYPYHLESWDPSRPIGKVGVLRPQDRPRLPCPGFDLVVGSRTEADLVDVSGWMACRGKPPSEARR